MNPKTSVGKGAIQPLTEDNGMRMPSKEPAPIASVPQNPRLQLPPIVRAPRDRSLPASFSQLREWFLQQLEGESHVYNIPLAMRLRGNLSIEALRQSINEIIRRHESLRTNFEAVDGEPVQVIKPKLVINIPIVDLRGLSESSRKNEIRRLMRHQARQPFDLTVDPLLRASLLRAAENEYILLLTMHHIISDGWSRGVLAKELKTIYRSFFSGQISTLPELTIQYADFAAWQRQWLDGPVLEMQLAYWKRQLEAAPAFIELPTDRPRPPVQTYRGAIETIFIHGELSKKLRELSRRRGVTLYMTLLSSFSVLLGRYTNQTDILVGTYIANRNRPEIEGLIGFFVNTLVMRTDISGNPSFLGLLEQVRRVTIEAFTHQDLPFEKLLESLQVERAKSHTPLFQVMLAHQNAAEGRLQLPGLNVTPLAPEHTRANFDMTLIIQQRRDWLQGTLEYNVDLFDQATVAQALQHFGNLLEGIASDPEQRIFDLPLLTNVERRRLLVEWNRTAAYDEPPGQCIQALIERQAAGVPEQIAVVGEDQHLSYEELNRRANRLAHHLRGKGVGADAIVGLCLPRSPEMLISLLGVLKAGAAYLALDPAYPRERLAYMINDSQVRLVITGSRDAGLFDGQAAERLLIDQQWPEVGEQSPINPVLISTADNLAYVIYTSGSAGQPKGVMVAHRSLVNFTAAVISHYGMTAVDRMLQFASINFDASAEEIYASLSSGATLELRSEEMLSSGRHFLEECERRQVSVLDLPTAYWHELSREMAEEELEAPAGLRLLIIGGEKANGERLRQWRQRAGSRVRLINSYGPTEATVVATAWEAPAAGEASDSHTVRDAPIGRGLANVPVYVVDEWQSLAPVGAQGELWIGGLALARGYLGQAVMTAEKFRPNPYGEAGGERVYRSGDVTRYTSDGQLEFVGRKDEQVKLRGYRVELGEIEAALMAHEGIKEAVVQALESGDNDKKLRAYLVAKEGEELEVRELKRALRRRLPEYMTPVEWVKVERLERTASGKVDRKKLREVGGEALQEEKENDERQASAIEELVAGIWEKLLGVEKVGVEENFFDAGGHSLLAIQVVSQIRQVFGVEISLRKVFEAPTVAGLAAAIEQKMRRGNLAATRLISAVERQERLVLSSAQERLWFLDQLSPGSAAYNIPTAMRMRGRLNVAGLEQSLREIVRRHESLRTSFTIHEGRPAQVIRNEVELELPTVDLREMSPVESEAETRRLAREEAGRAFDLNRGPVLRARLLKLAGGEHALLLTIHHIASDGWSTAVLVRELAKLYESFINGEASGLKELEIQYADYAAWQRQMLEGEALQEQLRYWREHLGGDSEPLELPLDRARPAVQSDSGAIRTVMISREGGEGLKRLGRANGATLFMTLMAGFKALLVRYSGQRQVVVGTPIAGRNYAEVEGLIGFFVNTLALKTDLAGDPEFKELLVREREVTLEAYLNQDLPFDKLVEELQPERDLGRTPLFQVMFALQNMPAEQIRLSGIELQPVNVEIKTVKFDLSLTLIERLRGLRCVMEYNADLFEEATISRMLSHYENLLAGVVADPERRISELPLLSETERRQLLIEWNQIVRDDVALERCIQELIEAQEARIPEQIAVVGEDQHLSYEELNRRANQLAHHLRGKGVGADAIVGLCLPRSPEMLIGLLGVLKAGAAYLALDPAYPRERLAYMINDSQVRLVITGSRDAGLFDGQAAERLLIDHQWPEVAKQSPSNPVLISTADNLAYVIYTSGSAGQPKGVMVAHRSLVNFTAAVISHYGMTAADRMLQFASINFDASAEEIYATLSSGVTVELRSEEMLSSGRRFLEECGRRQVSLLGLPTAYWHELSREMAEEELEAPASLRLLVIGGEKANGDRLRQWRQRAGGRVRFINSYGPTEATVGATAWEAPATGDASDNHIVREVPIGRGLANVPLYVVDEWQSLAPVGARGELWIGGLALARGYVGQAALTAEKFRPNPYSEAGGGRVYRSGDVTRYASDGQLEFVGRKDEQVKLRGYRVELGEIEATLMAHPDIKEAVVIPREQTTGERQLVGFVVPEAEEVKPRALRSYLKEWLPPFMIPATFITVSELPTLPNGKLDRSRLSALGGLRPNSESVFIAPRTTLEREISKIWSSVLQVEKIGINDNFFDLGGASLTLIQVSSKLKEVLSVSVPLIELFEYPTIGELAHHLSRQDNGQPSLQHIQDRASKQREAYRKQRRLAEQR
jgi:amino acid adenylation domain-containing protein